MACAFNISTNIDTLPFDWEGGNSSFTVTVDGNNSNSSFYIDNGNDYTWFTIERDRNTIIVRVDPYTEYDDGSNNREGFIRLIHNCDATKIAEVSVVQQGIEYGISADKYKITFPNLNENTATIKVTVKGGSKKFYVKSIKEYSKDPMTIDGQTIPIEIDYDNGLGLSIEDSTLHIHSYGRAFADEGNYYEITLAHRDYRYVTCVITVNYEEEEKDISLSKSEITFDYLGRVSNEDEDGLDYVEITINGSSGEYTDYGYTYGYPTDDEGEVLDDYSWLTITENPTSITITCDENCDAEDREATIIVYEYTEGKKGASADLIVSQSANTECTISVADSAITIPATIEAGETYTTTVRAYGGTKTCSGTINISDTWLKATMEQNTPTCLYTSYTITITPESNEGTERTATITVTHADNSSIQGVITIIQRGTNSDDYGIEHIGFGDDNNVQIIVSVSPETESPQITMASTATWCSLSQNVTTITVTCDTNNWNLVRKCGLNLSNALNPINELHYLVTQYTDSNFGISVV